MAENTFDPAADAAGEVGEVLVVHADAPVPSPAPGAPRPDREFTVQARTQRSIIWRRFRQHKLAMISATLLILVVLWAFIVPMFWKYQYNVETPDIEYPPSPDHPFGTNTDGTDMFAAIMQGTRRSLEIAFGVSILAVIAGTIIGAVSGFYRGVVDTVLMRVVDVFLTIPVIVIAILLNDKYPLESQTWWGLTLLLSLLVWAPMSRVVRGQVLSLREKEFVEAARALGATDRRIIFRHILPNMAGTLIVLFTLSIAGVILTESALSFLGFGVKFPDTSLGLLVSDGQQGMQAGHGWLFYYPGIFILVIALTANFIGDGLRDAFDPTQTRVRA